MENLIALKQLIRSQKAKEINVEGLELKRKWHQNHGKSLSALGNFKDREIRFLVIGVDDDGKISGLSENEIKKEETQFTSHVNNYLNPLSAIVQTTVFDTGCGWCLIVSIQNQFDVTEWDKEAYKRVGNSSVLLSRSDKLKLALDLPGLDYSKRPWVGETSVRLVHEFADILRLRGHPAIPEKLSEVSSKELLRSMQCEGLQVAQILFGDCKVRVAFYDKNGDVKTQTQYNGGFSILTEDFIRSIQTYSYSRGTVLENFSLSAHVDPPYPTKALRECLTNAVAHAFYERDDGDILVEIFPDRIVFRNNCTSDVASLAKDRFSKRSFARNKFLMQLLREAGFADELGSGKIRIFSQMIENGKREPVIEYFQKGNFGSWCITLYNESGNPSHLKLFEKFKSDFDSIEEARLAMALVLWRESSWHEIQEKLDEHFKKVALAVIHNPNSPVTIVGDSILSKRWVTVALKGKTSKSFSHNEEEQIKQILLKLSNLNGSFTSEEARHLIGLSNSPSERTQLSRLLRKWAEQKIVKRRRRGEWVFLTESAKQQEIIMSVWKQLNDHLIASKKEVKK